METDHPLIGKALIADLKRQLEGARQAHLVCIEMRNDAEAERDRLRAALKRAPCPGGGWTGQPEGMDPTIENCMAHDACGCIYGDALRPNGHVGEGRDGSRPL